MVIAQRSDLDLAEQTKLYRKQARMAQWVLAELLGLKHWEISDVELVRSSSDEVKGIVRAYLASAPRPRKFRTVAEQRERRNIYLTAKLLVWAEKANMPAEGVEAVRALKAAYEQAKIDQGLASIPLIQLEVENALTLATRGRYKRLSREMISERLAEQRRHG